MQESNLMQRPRAIWALSIGIATAMLMHLAADIEGPDFESADIGEWALVLLMTGVVLGAMRWFALSQMKARFSGINVMIASIAGLMLMIPFFLYVGELAAWFMFVGILLFPTLIVIIPVSSLSLATVLDGPLRLTLSSSDVRLGNISWSMLALTCAVFVLFICETDQYWIGFSISAAIYGWGTAPKAREQAAPLAATPYNPHEAQQPQGFPQAQHLPPPPPPSAQREQEDVQVLD